MPKKQTIVIDERTPEIMLYGMIDGDMAARIAEQIKYYEGCSDAIMLRINTPGGSILDGIAIYNLIKSCSVPVDGCIDGVAASMGGYIALATRRLFISKYGRIMLHEGKSSNGGTVEEMREEADMLEGCNNDLMAMVMTKTGMDEAAAKSQFFNGKDNWILAGQAKKLKLVDAIYDLDDVDMPEAADQTQVYALVAKWGNSREEFKNDNKKANMNTHNLSAEALVEMGLTASATDAQVIAAMNNRNAMLARQLNGTKKAEVKALLDNALDVEHKITAEYRAFLEEEYGGDNPDPERLKVALSRMPAFQSAVGQLQQSERQGGGAKVFTPSVKAYMDKGWDALDKSGEMRLLVAMEGGKDAYNELYKNKFGCYPNEKARPSPQQIMQMQAAAMQIK